MVGLTMFRATHTPPLSTMLDDLLTSSQPAIAKHLGVSVQTLRRWISADEAPRAAMLALFYETRWGYSLLETTAWNGRLWAEQRADVLERENARLRDEIARLIRLGQYGSANDAGGARRA